MSSALLRCVLALTGPLLVVRRSDARQSRARASASRRSAAAWAGATRTRGRRRRGEVAAVPCLSMADDVDAVCNNMGGVGGGRRSLESSRAAGDDTVVDPRRKN